MAVELADHFISKEDFMERASRRHMESLNFWKSGVTALHKLLDQLTFQRDDLMSKFSQVTSEKAKLKQEYEEKIHSQSMEIGKLQNVVALLNDRLNQCSKLSNDSPDSLGTVCKEGANGHNDDDAPESNHGETKVTRPSYQGTDVSTTSSGNVMIELSTQKGSTLKEHFTVKPEIELPDLERSDSSEKMPVMELVSFHSSKALTDNLRGQHLNDIADPRSLCTHPSISSNTPSSSYLVSNDVSREFGHDKVSPSSLDGALLLDNLKGASSRFHNESSGAQGDHNHIDDPDVPLYSQDSTLFKCSWCPYTSRTLSAFEQHNKKHRVAAPDESEPGLFKSEVDTPKRRSISKPIHCQECQTFFLGESEFQSHNESQHESTIMAIESNFHANTEHVLSVPNLCCPSCLHSFSSEADLKSHSASGCCDHLEHVGSSDVSTTSRSLVGGHRCQSCSVIFVSRQEYEVHLPCAGAMTDEGEKGASKGEKSSLSRSPSKQELSMEKEFFQGDPCPEVCPPNQCAGMSSTQTFPCQICPRIFLADADLRQHQLLHHADSTFPCSHCTKSFLSRTDLARHFRIHSETKSKRFKCSYCEKRFVYLKDKNRHEHVHTGYKPFQCDTCLKRFSRKDSLHTHLRTHSGEKPHHCEFCGKYFSQKSGLKSHMRATHTMEYAFRCHQCQKCFKFQQSFRAHLSSHSNPT